MTRRICPVLATVALAVLAQSLLIGDLFADGWDDFKSEYHQSTCWPYPYLGPDRQHVQAPFDLMIANGWRRQNLMGAHHFAPKTGKLTKAGEIHTYWILTQTPSSHRTVFVEQSSSDVETQRRLASVETFAATVLPAGKKADIELTRVMAEGRPAEVVDAVNLRFRESQPAPVLPTAQTGGDFD